MNRETSDSTALRDAFKKELQIVRRLRFPNIEGEQLFHLASVASDYSGDSTEDKIRNMLLELLDPAEQGRERTPLEKRDIKDEGLLGRWIYGQPERFVSPTNRDYVYLPATTKADQRDADLVALRGEGYPGSLMRVPRGGKGGPGWMVQQRVIADLVDLWEAQQSAAGSRFDLAAKWADNSEPRSCETECIELLDRREGPLVLFGQAGSGKSVLAARLARTCAARVAVLRASPGKPGESCLLGFDLFAALEMLDVDASGWSAAAMEHGLRKALAEKPEDFAIVFDDVPIETVETLLPEKLTVPTIVTARAAPTEHLTFSVDAYSEDEARRVATKLFPDTTEVDRTALTERVGRLPVAIFLASRLVASGRISISELSDYLLESPVSGMTILEAGERPSSQIVQLYRNLLESLEDAGQAREVLLGVCWFSSTAMSESEAWVTAPGAADRRSAKYRAALSVLEAHGLVSLDGEMIAVNDLTRLLVRDLTLAELEGFAGTVRRRVESLSRDGQLHEEAPVFQAIRSEGEILRQFLRDLLWPIPWEIWCLDPRSWIIFDYREIGDPSAGFRDEHDPYVSVIDLSGAELQILEWSSESQVRRKVQSDQLEWFAGMVAAFGFLSPLRYEESMRTGGLATDDWRFPGTPAPDGKRHDTTFFSVAKDSGEIVLSACGRAIGEAETGDDCPLCADRAIRRSTAHKLVGFFDRVTAVIDKFEPSATHANRLIELLACAAWGASELDDPHKSAWYLSSAARTACSLVDAELRLDCLSRLATRYCALARTQNAHASIWHLVSDELVAAEDTAGSELAAALSAASFGAD